MEKAIRITAIVSAVLQILYLIIGRLLGGIVLGPLLTHMPMGAEEEGIAYYLISQILIGGTIALIYFIFMVLMIFASKGKSEKIGGEIAGLLIIGFLLSIVSGVASFVVNYFINITGSGAAVVGTFASMSSGASFFGWIHGASFLLMIVSLTMSLCRKKFVIPLELELGYGAEDELGKINPKDEYGRENYNGNYQQDYQYTQNGNQNLSQNQNYQ